MANSLQDQLIRAGLADEAQAKPKQPARKPRPKAKGKPRPKATRRARPQPARPSGPEARALEQERKELRAMEQQRKREEQQEQQITRAKQQRREQARTFLLDHQQNDRTGELAFNFTADSRIRRLYVTEPQRARIQAGELLIVVLGKRDFLIERALHARLQAIDPELFVFDATVQADDAGAEDDPYKDYVVPDDLMW